MNRATEVNWPLTIIVSGVVLMVAGATAIALEQTEFATESGPQTLFTIGTENGSRDEQRQSGFMGVQQYECNAPNCVARELTMRIYRMSMAKIFDVWGVAQLKLDFRLSRRYDNAVLRLAHWGVQTDLVTIDNRPAVAVTASMLGSGEDIPGTHDLNIGPLPAGRHTIGIRAAENNAGGSRRHSWDSISLTVW